MNMNTKEIMKEVKDHKRLFYTIGSGLGLLTTCVLTWVNKDKIIADFENTKDARRSDDPEERKQGYKELGKGLVRHLLPVLASATVTEVCNYKSYTSASATISAGAEALSGATAALYRETAKVDALERKYGFEKPYDDGPTGTAHDVQNQAAYATATEALLKEAIANGYQLAYFVPTGSYLFYEGDIDDVLSIANTEIRCAFDLSNRDGFATRRYVSITTIKDALGITDVADCDEVMLYTDKSTGGVAPQFYKRRPYATHGVNLVMWEIYTNEEWTKLSDDDR